jgi:WhiB family transcriptional regulator, redox-sensing transcriptional regulator
MTRPTDILLPERGNPADPNYLTEMLPEWHLDAACRGMDPSLFFPNRGESTRIAKQTCAKCPVQPECLDWAVSEVEPAGIWGGLGERDRRQVRKRGAA